MIQFAATFNGQNFVRIGFRFAQSVAMGSKLEVQIFIHQIGNEDIFVIRQVFHAPFNEEIQFQPIPDGKMLRVNAVLTHGHSIQQRTIFTFTKHKQNKSDVQSEGSFMRPDLHIGEARKQKMLSTTEQMIRTIGNINGIQNPKQLSKTILAARKSKDVESFINQTKALKRQTRQQRAERTMLVTQGILLFDQIYGHSRQGCQMLKNDWFMGPFYSYQANQKALRK